MRREERRVKQEREEEEGRGTGGGRVRRKKGERKRKKHQEQKTDEEEGGSSRVELVSERQALRRSLHSKQCEKKKCMGAAEILTVATAEGDDGGREGTRLV